MGRITGTSVGFAAASTYEIAQVVASGYSLYTSEVCFCTPPVVGRFINDAEEFTEKGAVSLDELFTCYSTNEEDGFTFADFEAGSNISPSGFFHADLKSRHVASGINIGLCPTFGDELPANMTEVQDKQDVINIRSVAFRVPSMFAGFGYTTEGFPVPSLYDDFVATSGQSYFQNPTESGKIEWYKRNFARRFRERQDLWKAGPFDSRWDADKCMWVASPEVFQGYAIQNISSASGRYAPTTFSSGEIELITGPFKGSFVPNPKHKLLIINRSITVDIQSGAYVTVIRANNGEYIPLHVDCAADRSGVYD